MRKVWKRMAQPAIERAVAGGLGMRIIEELMVTVLLELPTAHSALDHTKLHSPDRLV